MRLAVTQINAIGQQEEDLARIGAHSCSATMAKSDRQLDQLRERLSSLLADWGAEVSAVMDALESQQSLAASQVDKVQAFEDQAGELAKLRQRIHERDLVLDHVTSKSKEKDTRLARLEKEHKKARERIEELERLVAAADKPAQPLKSVEHEEFEAMRAEAVARKSLVKSLRTDAERGKALERELAQNREVMTTLKETIDRHARTIEELRRGSASWEQKYRQLAEAASKRPARDGVPRDPGVAPLSAETREVDGTGTVVIDMTEPLRAARDEHRKKGDRR